MVSAYPDCPLVRSLVHVAQRQLLDACQPAARSQLFDDVERVVARVQDVVEHCVAGLDDSQVADQSALVLADVRHEVLEEAQLGPAFLLGGEDLELVAAVEDGQAFGVDLLAGEDDVGVDGVVFWEEGSGLEIRAGGIGSS